MEVVLGDYIFIVPLIGLCGVIIGAIIQAALGRRNQRSMHLSELQNKSYADFLNSISRIAVAQRKNDSKEIRDALSQLADAKSRICIYGEPTVIHNLAKFLRLGGTLQTEQEILAFTNLCLEIRRSNGILDKSISPQDISQLLFNVDIKD